MVSTLMSSKLNLWPGAVSGAPLYVLSLLVPDNAHPHGYDLPSGIREVLTGW